MNLGRGAYPDKNDNWVRLKEEEVRMLVSHSKIPIRNHLLGITGRESHASIGTATCNKTFEVSRVGILRA